MLENFKKAIFRALCLGCALIGGGGLMAEPNHEKLLNLGMLSYDKQDFSKARKYFEKACDLKDGRGCDDLGRLYYYGRGVEKNSKKAAHFYSKACELKEGDGCGALGALYYNGDGVKQDSKKAVALFEKACKLGYKEVCEMVTYKGLCELGHKEACEIFSLEVLCRLSDLKACAMSYDKKKALGF